MARRRFFVPQVRRGATELTGDEAEHLVKVLRAEVGQVYEISDNECLYLAKITQARKSIVSFEVMEELGTPLSYRRMILGAALFKFDHFEWLVEKATELGVDEIVPFEAVRSERGLTQGSAKRKIRWERIALEASQQSRRWRLPVIRETVSFEEALAVPATVRLFLDEEQSAPPIFDVLRQAATDSEEILVLLGPEGGWTDSEREQAKSRNCLACSLGANILRAETAGIASLSVISSWISAEFSAR